MNTARVTLMLLVATLVFSVGVWAAQKEESAQTIAVLDFESIGSEGYLGKAVAEIMRTELVGTKRFRVVERAQIKQALSEQALQSSGAIDNESAVQLGKLLGADLIIVGSVVKIGSAYTINSRMIDVKTGEARLGKNATGNDLNLLTTLSRQLIEGLFGVKSESPLVAATSPQPPEPKITKTEVIDTTESLQLTNFDFERGDLAGWQAAGEAFAHQPTYGDNPTARRRGQPSHHQGDYWIGTFERRPHSSSPAGAIQGDGPRGTLVSDPFTISADTMSFLIGGGCDVNRVRVELMVGDRVVTRTTGRCNETMFRHTWQVADHRGKQARIRLIDDSSGGWGHINFDDLRIEDQPTANTSAIKQIGGTITWDFEDPALPGWQREGDAFARQPTYGDNPTARRRGQPSAHQGNYWIGGYENRPGPGSLAGEIQGDGPQGRLVSDTFRIESSHISFLIGGGCDRNSVYAALVVAGREVARSTGKCNETMQRERWDVTRYKGQEARLEIVDRSSGGWGHINVDDFRFD